MISAPVDSWCWGLDFSSVLSVSLQYFDIWTRLKCKSSVASQEKGTHGLSLTVFFLKIIFSPPAVDYKSNKLFWQRSLEEILQVLLRQRRDFSQCEATEHSFYWSVTSAQHSCRGLTQHPLRSIHNCHFLCPKCVSLEWRESCRTPERSTGIIYFK